MNARSALALILTCSTIAALLPGAPAGADSPPCIASDKVPVPAKGSGIRVEQICHDALSLSRLDNVRLINVDESEHVATISLNDPFNDGEGVVVPEASSLDIVSDHGNRMHPANGIRTTIRRYAPTGESYGLDGSGIASFNILNALDFWNVFVAHRFIAAVHGTLFSVDLRDPQNVTFTVARGTVTITRFVEARILSTGQLIDGLRTNIKISPEGTQGVTYARGPEIYRTFKDRADAHMQLYADLAKAQQSNDADDIEDATDNLLRLDTISSSSTLAAPPSLAAAPPLVPAVPPPVASLPVPPAAGAAAAPPVSPFLYQAAGAGIVGVIVAVLVGNKSQSTSPSAPMAVSTSEPGGLGVSSRARETHGVLGSVLRSLVSGFFGHRHAHAAR